MAEDDDLEAELEALLVAARAQQSLIRLSLTTLTEYLRKDLPN